MAITPTAVDTGVPKRKSSGAGGAHMPLQMNLSGRISPMDAMSSTPSQFRHALSSATVPTVHHANLLFNKAPDCTMLSLGRCSLMIGLFWAPPVSTGPTQRLSRTIMHSRGLAAMSEMLLQNMPKDVDTGVDNEKSAWLRHCPL